MELVLVEATQLSELIDTVRELKNTVKEILSSAVKPSEPTSDGYVTRKEAMAYLHIKSNEKFAIVCKRYDFNMRRVGKHKLFKLSHLEKVLVENGNKLDLSPLTEKEKINCVIKNL